MYQCINTSVSLYSPKMNHMLIIVQALTLAYIFIVRNVDSQAAPACRCVPINTCYQSSSTDGSGQIDIRIVNTGQPGVTLPPGVTTAPPPTTTRAPGIVVPPGSTLAPAIVTCAAGTESCCSPVTGCGVRWTINPNAAITPSAGQAPYGSQPWAAVILGTDNSYIGGGVLLDPLNVLTVAHKVINRTTASIKVRMGEWDSARTVETYPVQEGLVVQIKTHPSFNPRNLFNDIAILRLATPITLGPTPNPAINTACLPTATTVADRMRCLVSGWGQNAFNGTYQLIIREVDVPVIPNVDCQNSLRTTRLGPSFALDSNSFMCAGGEAGRDACIGDGGAGLMCLINGKYQVVGLVAWGIGCATQNVPGVYVKVQNFLPWIQSSLV